MSEPSGSAPISRRRALGALGSLSLPFGLLGAAAPWPRPSSWPTDPSERPAGPFDPGPDLGNLHGVVEWVAAERAPSLSFLDPRWTSLEAWKAEARLAVHRHHGFDPAPPPVHGEVVDRERRGDLEIETVRIHASPAYSIAARVVAPAGRRGRLPAVVALHCHGGQYRWGSGKLVSSPADPPTLVEYRDSLYGRPVAEHLARRGFVVIAIDAFYFGERRLRPESLDPAAVPAEAREHFASLASLPDDAPERVFAANRVAGAYEAVVAKTLFAAGATWPGLLAWDDRRTVDYLAGRPDVDAERIGCVGLSGGALRAVHLVASDPRVRAACVTAWMTEFRAMLPHHARRHTWMAYTPVLGGALDLPDLAALLAPGALMVQQCEHDRLFPRHGMQGALDRIAAVYAKAGIPDRFRGVFYDEPHSFRPHMQDDAFAWFERWL